MFKRFKKFTSTFITAVMVLAGVNIPANHVKASDVEEDVMEVVTSEADASEDAQIYEQDVNLVGASVSCNYAKLLQYSLYFYDANMCGDEVGETSLLDWRDDCHTFDTTTYTRADGSTVNVDLTGGFHDAGDHVKFGLPEAYAAFVLGMSYETNQSAYDNAKQSGHLENITTYFADYFVDCTVLSADGNSVEAFCIQVGNGGGSYDHGYWGAPENQTNANRPIVFTSASEPATDIVCLSAAALAMQYINFGGDEYLDTAKKLFAYADSNSKAVGTAAQNNEGTYYSSSAWEDDYCLAALMLYKATNDSKYYTAFNNYQYNANAQKPYWPLGWDNVGPAVAYYNNNSSAINTLVNIEGGTTIDNYFALQDWGSARYNTSLQYVALLYGKMTGTTTYRNWAESQMQYLLGNNSKNICFVTGYNSYSAKYPHHRAAAGGVKGTTTQAHTLIGALVGGPKKDGSYVDSADEYVYNEVAIDYNATLVAAAAALYDIYSSDTTNHYIDTNYYYDTEESGGESGGSTGGESGGNTGGETGGESGGSTGGETGGESGGSTGGETGGESGGNTGGESSGTTSSGNWVSENGNWYYVDDSGNRATGWQQVDGEWYYMNSNGAMQTGWLNDNGTWYYLNSDGSMATSTWIGSEYVDASGVWVNGGNSGSNTYTEGWQLSGGLWWYQNADGSYPVNAWKAVGGAWYYFDASGWMKTGWVNDGSGWYYMNPSGAMATGWINDGGLWYYLAGSGLMKTGWLYDAGAWYYLVGSGAMATNTVIDGYTIDSNGAWIP